MAESSPSSLGTMNYDTERIREQFEPFRFRCLIIGRVNAGKTTILQEICNSIKDPEIFCPVGYQVLEKLDSSVIDPSFDHKLHNIEVPLVFKSNPRFVFHDSRGFEAVGTDEFNEVQNFITKRTQQTMLGDRLHVIWYCIPVDDGERLFTKVEQNFFSECNTNGVHVIVVFTKFDALAHQELADTDRSFERIPVLQTLDQLRESKYPPKSYVFLRNLNDPELDRSSRRGMDVTESNCDKLLQETVSALDDKLLRQLLMKTQISNEKLHDKSSSEDPERAPEAEDPGPKIIMAHPLKRMDLGTTCTSARDVSVRIDSAYLRTEVVDSLSQPKLIKPVDDIKNNMYGIGGVKRSRDRIMDRLQEVRRLAIPTLDGLELPTAVPEADDELDVQLESGRNHVQALLIDRQPISKKQVADIVQMIVFDSLRKLDERSNNIMESALDLVFIQDTSASMRLRVFEAYENILQVLFLFDKSPRVRRDELRVGLVSYHDHNKEVYVTHHDFTTSVSDIRDFLRGLKPGNAARGCAYPKSAEAALGCALKKMSWRGAEGVARIVVLITDTPPHGTGEDDYDYPDEPFFGYENLGFIELVGQMERKGIHLIVIGYEPYMSRRFSRAEKIYEAMAGQTRGLYCPVVEPYNVATAIVRTIMRVLDMRLIKSKREPEAASSREHGKRRSGSSHALGHAHVHSRPGVDYVPVDIAESAISGGSFLAPIKNEYPYNPQLHTAPSSSIQSTVKIHHALACTKESPVLLYDVVFAPSEINIVYPFKSSSSFASSIASVFRSSRKHVQLETPLPAHILAHAATRPSIRSLMLVIPGLPSDWEVRAVSMSATMGPEFMPLTVLDVMHAVYTSLRVPVTRREWNNLGNGSIAQKRVAETYKRRCEKLSSARDEREAGVRRSDFLCGRTALWGVESRGDGRYELVFGKPTT